MTGAPGNTEDLSDSMKITKFGSFINKTSLTGFYHK
jgi:hypothetical protein